MLYCSNPALSRIFLSCCLRSLCWRFSVLCFFVLSNSTTCWRKRFLHRIFDKVFERPFRSEQFIMHTVYLTFSWTSFVWYAIWKTEMLVLYYVRWGLHLFLEYGINWYPFVVLGDTKYKNNTYLMCFSHWSGRFYLLTVCRALSVPLSEHSCSRNMALMSFSCWLQAPDLLNTFLKWVLNVYSKVTGSHRRETPNLRAYQY